MHIAIVTRNMNAGGAERVIAQLLQGWVGAEVECSLLCMEPTPSFYSVPDAVTCYNIPHFSDRGSKNKIRKYSCLRRLLRKLRPDAVLSLPEEIGIYVALFLAGTGIPVIVSERNDPKVMPYKKITRALRRIVYPFVKGLIFQTETAAAFFPAAQRKKGIVLPNPLDCGRLPDRIDGKREKTVVGAGRLEPQKNFDLLLDAFADFYRSHGDYRLVIYGEGSLRKQLTEHIESLSLPAGAISLPGVDDALPEKISRAGMFVLSSDYEGMPNVLLEAMACGVPCVATDCPSGGPAEIISCGKNGFLVPPGDRAAMAACMGNLADDPDLAGSFSAEYQQIRHRFDAGAVCAAWLDYIKSVIAGGKKPAEG